MFPILAELGPFHLYSYGLSVAAGVALAFFLMQKAALKDGFPTTDQAYDCIFISVVTGFIGARLFYVVQHPEEFQGNPLEVFAIWQGGLIFYGGLAGGVFALWIYAAKQKLSFLKLMDFIFPYGALVHAFGRLGCFLNGCCYGRACDWPWAVQFPGLDHPVHPTQLYEAFYTLGVFFILRAYYQRRPQTGMVTAGYLLLYGIGRFIVEIFRSGNPGWFLTWNQWISAVVMMAGLTILLWRSRRWR
jgi:phosphatidylglycerol:prolipoprotein diacylglycerol transferase